MSNRAGRQWGLHGVRHGRLHGGGQKGVGLIEVLIALIVLSLGLLVAVNMQLQSIRSNQDSYYHSQALMLANEMMDRMIGNPEGVADGDYNGKQTAATAADPGCANSGCDAANQALLDIFEWSAKLHDLRNESSFIPLLPTSIDGTPASGSVSSPDIDGVYTVTMSWTRMDGDTQVTETLPVRFIP